MTRPTRRQIVILAVALASVLAASRHAGTALVVLRPLDAPQAILPLASHEWERLPEAAARARAGGNAIVLLTVPREVKTWNCYRCSERAEWLVQLGVPPGRILTLPAGVENTFDEARAALAFCREHHITSLLVVTSPYHTRRAYATFQAVFAGAGVIIGVQPAADSSPARPARWWRASYDRWYVRYEWGALMYYMVRHGVLPW